jgi:hypothetical protein
MRIFRLFFISMLLFPCCGWAEYGPLLTRVDPALASQACQEAGFTQREAIVSAVRSQNSTEIENVLGLALEELKTENRSSTKYAAKAFCVHEIIPSLLPAARNSIRGHVEEPTNDVKKFRSMGIIYKFYDPDGSWKLREGPVDLPDLATKYLNSIWGRRAFLMMTQIGWSEGACQEGPDQFREVIKHGEAFLSKFPNSEVSDDVRVAVADAYTTWWVLSLKDADSTVDHSKYEVGAEDARKKAISLFRAYLKPQSAPQAEVLKTIKALEQKQWNLKVTLHYFCGDYED